MSVEFQGRVRFADCIQRDCSTELQRYTPEQLKVCVRPIPRHNSEFRVASVQFHGLADYILANIASLNQKIVLWVVSVQFHGIGQVGLVAGAAVRAPRSNAGRSPTTWSRQLGEWNLNQRNLLYFAKWCNREQSCDEAWTESSNQLSHMLVISTA